MKYKVKYLPRADRDLIEINEVLAEYPRKAVRLFQEIDRKVRGLEDMPRMWPVYQPRPRYRRMVLEDYLLFYIVDEPKHEVYVYRIIYYRMDIPRQL